MRPWLAYDDDTQPATPRRVARQGKSPPWPTSRSPGLHCCSSRHLHFYSNVNRIPVLLKESWIIFTNLMRISGIYCDCFGSETAD